MESRHETGPKAETGEDRSSRTRQNNKTADRKVTSLRFQTGRGEISETSGLPSGLPVRRGLGESEEDELNQKGESIVGQRPWQCSYSRFKKREP